MRYWILVASFTGLLALVMHFTSPDMAASELFTSTEFRAGTAICCLIALAITWNDQLDGFFFLFKCGALGIVLGSLVWIIGYKLNLWGNHNSGGAFAGVSDNMERVINGTIFIFGALIICGAAWWLIRKKNR